MSEGPSNSIEYRVGIFNLNERRKAVFAEYMIAKAKTDELKKELDDVDAEIMTFKESFGFRQNVR